MLAGIVGYPSLSLSLFLPLRMRHNGRARRGEGVAGVGRGATPADSRERDQRPCRRTGGVGLSLHFPLSLPGLSLSHLLTYLFSYYNHLHSVFLLLTHSYSPSSIHSYVGIRTHTHTRIILSVLMLYPSLPPQSLCMHVTHTHTD